MSPMLSQGMPAPEPEREEAAEPIASSAVALLPGRGTRALTALAVKQVLSQAAELTGTQVALPAAKPFVASAPVVISTANKRAAYQHDLQERAIKQRQHVRAHGATPMRRRLQSIPQPTSGAPAHAMAPTILARRNIVTVLVGAPFDAWYDQWMLQVDDTDDAAEVAGVDYFDDAVRMLEPAAMGMATAALRAHFDAHQAESAAAGVWLLVEPLVPQDDEIVCLLGVLETMHEEGQGWREEGELSFVETVEQYALIVPAYRDDAMPFPSDVFAPGDPFFSAVDQTTVIGNATLADIKAHPEQYALVDVQVTTLYARVQRLGQVVADPTARALTA